MQITVDGVVETLPDGREEYKDAFTTACESMKESLDIVRSPGFDDHSTWKFDCENEFIKVYYKDMNGLRYFSARVKAPLSCEEGNRRNWEGVVNMPDWNENIRYSRILHHINDHCDITNYASNKKFAVDSRDFVAARMMKRTDDGRYIISAKSCQISTVPEDKDAVRGVLHLGMGMFTPDPEDPKNRSTYDYLICMDLCGFMPKFLMNQVMGKLVLSDIENYRQNVFSKNG
ncbi:hypothetical protein WR25_19197 [Diploscapter pachys]|uniref:START domain-containing protein n=1 Tax=Diploscapter pachys TaxID=2018661 RepID=A0A2A2KRJ4_9BILA|nr:hypothetical protein WR25_19197 [Diploscapter pachys]